MYYVDQFKQWLDEKDRIKDQTPRFERASTQGSIDFSLNRVYSLGQSVANRLGFEVRRIQQSIESGPAYAPTPYVENPEAGGINLHEKKNRKENGGYFEWPNMVALNWACTKLIGNAETILEIGGGTGCFTYEASAVTSCNIICADVDEEAIDWARKHRSRENIKYVSDHVTEAFGLFDLVVAVDVIEHIEHFSDFIRICCHLADRAVLTTPNKQRDHGSDSAGPPAYYQHVREWSAGEFYWILKSFYKNVSLYAMPDVYVPEICPVDVKSKLTPLIAECSDPLFKKNRG
jgi:hypothetical protein